jgi:hypothetical protein
MVGQWETLQLCAEKESLHMSASARVLGVKKRLNYNLKVELHNYLT